MQFIDTHTHIYDKAFDTDRNQTVERAIEAGITTMVLPACNENSIAPMIELQTKWPNNIKCAIGLHPEDISNPDSQLDQIFSQTQLINPIAIGEIGIDLYWRKDNLQIQQQVFEYQIRKAIEMNLPIIIHCRQAYNEVFQCLNKFDKNILSGIFHCFSGDVETAQQALSYPNFMLGIGGVCTFKNSGQETAQTISKCVPLNRIVLETDAPYISPVPYRGRRNEPAYMLKTAEKLAEILNVPIQQIANQTTINAKKILKLN